MEQQHRRRQILTGYGPIASFQRVGDDDSQRAESYSIPYLPEDIWRHIHSLMPLCDAARAACLSRAFLHSWKCYPNLNLNYWTIRSKGNFNCEIDSILRNHSGIGLKILKLNLENSSSALPYIDGWLQIAVTPGIEELTLMLYEKYHFPCSVLSSGVRNSIRCFQLDSCVFRPTAELGPLRSLTSLQLQSVCITGDELECLLWNSLALEKLDIFHCEEIIFLKIPCALKQLTCLIVACGRLQVIEIKAPNVSSIDLIVPEVKLSIGEASQVKNLYMRGPSIFYASTELPFIMPNLETLDLASEVEVHAPVLPTKFLYLKHLTMYIRGGVFSPSYDYLSLFSFFSVSPSLETLFLDVPQICMKHESVFEGPSHLRQLPEHRHDRLKSVEILEFSSAKSLVELTCCIIKNAPALECLTLDTLRGARCFGENSKTCTPISKTLFKEASRTVVAIKTYIEDKVLPTAKLTVLEPCTRCHSSGSWWIP